MCVHAGEKGCALDISHQPCHAMFTKRRRAARHSQNLATMQDHASPWLQICPCRDPAAMWQQQYTMQLDIKTSVGSIAYCTNDKLPCSPLLSEVVAHEAKGPVRVVFLGVKSSIVHDVLEGIVHQTSSTASILALHTHHTSLHLKVIRHAICCKPGCVG